MNPCDQFIADVRRELDSTYGEQPTRFLKSYQGQGGVKFDAAFKRRRRRGGLIGRVAICSPPFPHAGYGIAIDPGMGAQTVIYATRDDLLSLPRTVARLFAQPPEVGGLFVWCTAAARRGCSNDDMNEPDTKVLEDLS